MRRIEVSAMPFLTPGDWTWRISSHGRIIRQGEMRAKTQGEVLAYAFGVARDLALKGWLVPQQYVPQSTASSAVPYYTVDEERMTA